MNDSRVDPGAVSAVDQIRQLEIDLARKIEAAQDRAEEMRREMHEHIAKLKKQAVEEGRKQGEQEALRLRKEAGAKSERILHEAEGRAEALRKEASARKAEAVRLALDVLLGAREGSEKA